MKSVLSRESKKSKKTAHRSLKKAMKELDEVIEFAKSQASPLKLVREFAEKLHLQLRELQKEGAQWRSTEKKSKN